MTVADADLSALADSHNILQLGMAADEVRRRLHGLRTTFVRVRRVSAEPDAPIASTQAAGEIRIEGVPADRQAAVARVARVRAAAPGVPLSGYSLADLEQMAVRDGVTLRALLEDLAAAGLEAIGEAPVDLLLSAHRSIEEVNIAGLTLARLTVHRLASADVMPLLKTVAELQRSVAVIRAFAPLPRTVNPAIPTTGFDDMKRVALARMVVDNIPSIQVDWSLYGPKLAQVALTVGADDVDAVSVDEDEDQGRRRAPLEEIRRNIRAAGLEPAERNGRFELVAA